MAIFLLFAVKCDKERQKYLIVV